MSLSHTHQLFRNALTTVPVGVFAMNLTVLSLGDNKLTSIEGIGRLKALRKLHLGGNRLTALPRELGYLPLQGLWVNENALTAVPSSLGRLSELRELSLNNNRISWLPLSLDRLPLTSKVFLGQNALPLEVPHNARTALRDIIATTAHLLQVIRDEAATLAIGLQDLELPALVTLEIIDAAFPNSIPMHKKWDLVVAVKHFRERRPVNE